MFIFHSLAVMNDQNDAASHTPNSINHQFRPHSVIWYNFFSNSSQKHRETNFHRTTKVSHIPSHNAPLCRSHL